MLCNTTSIYPNGIDSMMFFQDNDLDKIEIINEYEKLIIQGKYNEANNFIENQQGIYGYFADFFNAIENRIYVLQEYLLNKSPKDQPFIYYDCDDFPIELYQSGGTHLVLGNEEHDILSQFNYEELENVKEINGSLQVSDDIKNIIWI